MFVVAMLDVCCCIVDVCVMLLLFVVKRHNLECPTTPIRTVLCPGLGTAVGRMPVLRCAVQMRVAYEAVMFGNVEAINKPTALRDCCSHHVYLYKVRTLGNVSSEQIIGTS